MKRVQCSTNYGSPHYVQMIRHSSDVYSLGGSINSARTNKVYRLRGGIWTGLSSMTTARYYFAAVLYDNTIFVFGGLGAESSVEAFDIAAQSWTNKATPPSGAQQYRQAAVLYRDLIWQCGGVPVTNACFTFNPRTNTWAASASMTTERYNFGLVLFGDSIYAIGGASPSTKTAERYNTTTNAWEAEPGNLTNDANNAVILPID